MIFFFIEIKFFYIVKKLKIGFILFISTKGILDRRNCVLKR